MSQKLIILAIILSLAAAQHHHFDIGNLVGHWHVNIEAGKGERNDGAIEKYCQEYSFPMLRDDSGYGFINHTFYDSNHTYNHPHKILFRDTDPQDWYVPDRNETIHAIYTDNFEKEQAAILHIKHRDSNHEMVRLLTREHHPSDLVYEDFARVLQYLNFTGSEINYVPTDCGDHHHHDFDVSVLHGSWHLAWEAFDNYTHKLPHDLDACEIFSWPAMLNQDELAEFDELIINPNGTEHHHFFAQWKVHWHKEHPQEWAVDPIRQGEDETIAMVVYDGHPESQKNVIFFHFHPEHREYSVRLLTREEELSEAAKDHFLLFLKEINFKGQLVEWREECRHMP